MQIYITIVVPVYKVEKYIHRCVDSLINQDIEDEQYEVLLIDDGSPDQCGTICDEYAKQYRNIVSFHKENGGLSDARNYGVSRAKGKYILFVDSDDYIEENCLGSIINTCMQQDEPEVLFLQAQKVYLNYKKKYDDPIDIGQLQQDKHSVLMYLSGRNIYPASAWSKMVKREVLLKNDILFKVGQLSEDYEWSLDIYLKANTFGAYNGSYYFYRQNREGSITSGVSEKHFKDIIGIIENIELEVKDYPEEKEFILSVAAYIYRVLLWYAPKYYNKYKKQIKSKKYLLSKRKSSDVVLIRNTSKLVGIGGAIRLLNLYGKLRK